VTVNFGFHRRSQCSRDGGRHPQQGRDLRRRAHSPARPPDRLRHRRPPSALPNEAPFVYKPHADEGLVYRWDEKAKAEIKDYNLLDLSI